MPFFQEIQLIFDIVIAYLKWGYFNLHAASTSEYYHISWRFSVLYIL